MHNNANKVHFSCPVAAVKWPFQYFFWIKYSSEMEQNCFGLINIPFVTRVLIEGNCCCQWEGVGPGGKS
jgi:hypothetical protein